MKRIVLDKKGMEQYQNAVELTRQKLGEAQRRKSEAAGGSFDWHDNAAFDSALNDERMMQAELKYLLELSNNIQFIDRKKDSTTIDIGDTIKANVNFVPNKPEMVTFLLTANFKSETFDSDEIEEVSINSPLGSTLYNKKANESFSYAIGNRTINGVIISFENSKEKLNKLSINDTTKKQNISQMQP